MSKVFLREKKLLHGKRSLYLDFYPPVIVGGKPTRREHLKLYVYSKPKTETEREHNKETRILGENIRSQRQLDIQAADYGFTASGSKRKSFIDYFRNLVESKRKNSKSNYKFWHAIQTHLETFAGEVSFGDVTEKFLEDFKSYLLARGLAQNTASIYFASFRAAVNKAAENNLIAASPAKRVTGIPTMETSREFLTLSELQDLNATPCRLDDLKRAALFSALTGLRFSDIQKLLWSELYFSQEQGHYIRFRQKKTKGLETLPISEEAYEFLGLRGDGEVFNLKKWHLVYFLPGWIKSAGIERPITFHSFRHTYAALQLLLGTDIYTLSKMLGHKKLETTEIYAKIVDRTKREAANKISLK